MFQRVLNIYPQGHPNGKDFGPFSNTYSEVPGSSPLMSLIYIKKIEVFWNQALERDLGEKRKLLK